MGEDACALDVPGGTLVVAADPITLTSEEPGKLAVIASANDVAVTGARPRWFLAVVLVPPGTDAAAVGDLLSSLAHAACELGAALVGGHTEVTPAVSRPLVVGQMLGLAEAGRVVATGGLAPGDVVLQVRPAPIEGAAVLAREAGPRLAGVDPALLRAAQGALEDPGISVVEPALLACQLRVKALHDPTEGGLAMGLLEMAVAAGVRIRVDRRAVLWFPPGLAVCRALGADPWATLASGTLLVAVEERRAEAVLSGLSARGYPACRIGVAENGSGICDLEGRPIEAPERDEVARLLGGEPAARST